MIFPKHLIVDYLSTFFFFFFLLVQDYITGRELNFQGSSLKDLWQKKVSRAEAKTVGL